MKKNKINMRGKLLDVFSFNIAVSPDSIVPLLPASKLTADKISGITHVSLLVGTLSDLRPANIKLSCGLNYKFAAYQIPVKINQDTNNNIYSYFYKIFLSHPLPSVLGNIFTTFHFDTAHIDSHRIGGQIVVTIDVPHENKYHFSCHGQIDSGSQILPQPSAFNSWENSVNYFSSINNLIVWNPQKSAFDKFNIPFIGTPLPLKLDEFDFPWIRNLKDVGKWQLESAVYLEGQDFLWSWKL